MRAIGPWIGIALALLGPLARAADAPVAPEVATARAHYQAGKVYFEQGDLRRALKEFQEAARDAGRPELDFNIARTYDRLAEPAHALEHYRRYLRSTPSGGARAEVEARIAELETQVGGLLVRTHTAGAQILIDEESVPASELTRPVSLGQGAHRVVAAKEGFLSATATAQVVAGKVTAIEIDPIGGAAARPRSRWWIGLVVGGAAVVVAGAVVAGVLVGRGGGAPTYSGNVPPYSIGIAP